MVVNVHRRSIHVRAAANDCVSHGNQGRARRRGGRIVRDLDHERIARVHVQRWRLTPVRRGETVQGQAVSVGGRIAG